MISVRLLDVLAGNTERAWPGPCLTGMPPAPQHEPHSKPNFSVAGDRYPSISAYLKRNAQRIAACQQIRNLFK